MISNKMKIAHNMSYEYVTAPDDIAPDYVNVRNNIWKELISVTQSIILKCHKYYSILTIYKYYLIHNNCLTDFVNKRS